MDEVRAEPKRFPRVVNNELDPQVDSLGDLAAQWRRDVWVRLLTQRKAMVLDVVKALLGVGVLKTLGASMTDTLVGLVTTWAALMLVLAIGPATVSVVRERQRQVTARRQYWSSQEIGRRRESEATEKGRVKAARCIELRDEVARLEAGLLLIRDAVACAEGLEAQARRATHLHSLFSPENHLEVGPIGAAYRHLGADQPIRAPLLDESIEGEPPLDFYNHMRSVRLSAAELRRYQEGKRATYRGMVRWGETVVGDLAEKRASLERRMPILMKEMRDVGCG